MSELPVNVTKVGAGERIVVHVDSRAARWIGALALLIVFCWLIVLLAHDHHHANWHAAGRLAWSLTILAGVALIARGIFLGRPVTAAHASVAMVVLFTGLGVHVLSFDLLGNVLIATAGLVLMWPTAARAQPDALPQVWALVTETHGDPLARFAMQSLKSFHFTRTAVSNETGAYSFTNVLAGNYDVKVTLQGFKEAVKTGVPVSVNEVSRVNAALEIGGMTDTVTVASDLQLLQTDKADTHTEITSAAITQLPLPQNRNYQSLINLVPGATPAAVQNSEVDTPGRALTTNVNGMDRNNNGTKTDGATNVNIWLPHHTMIVSPAETIDTVNVSTSNFDAEQGMAGGAAITVITKSGTNSFKGSAFAFYNNENLNAKAYFATVKNPASAHIDGATVGGPILKNRLFFFGAWEGQYQTTPQQFFYNVPPPALRVGDFSQAFNPDGSLQVIYDPRTGNPDGTGRVPFPGNVIPADLIDPIAQTDPGSVPAPERRGHHVGRQCRWSRVHA